jgi:hypothetical protein
VLVVGSADASAGVRAAQLRAAEGFAKAVYTCHLAHVIVMHNSNGFAKKRIQYRGDISYARSTSVATGKIFKATDVHKQRHVGSI